MTITSGGKEYKSETVKKAIVDGNIAYYQEYENEKKEEVKGGIFNRSEMTEFIAYLQKLNLELIPAINSPGHMNALLLLAI